METFEQITRLASEDALRKLDSHFAALREILDPLFAVCRYSPKRHCFTFLALHEMDAMVTDELKRRENAHEEARRIAARYLKLEFPEADEGEGAPESTAATPPEGKPQPISS